VVRATIAVVALLIACNEERPRTAQDYVATCRPGGSSRDCYWSLKKAPAKMLPAGRLEGIEFRTELLAEPGQNRVTDGVSPRNATFLHVMKFNVGRDDVMTVLVKELGEPLKQGTPPLATMRLLEGAVWESDEGFWVCGDRVVAWYSKPVRTTSEQALPTEPARELERYVQPAPKSAALWGKVGQLLIGLDNGPH
jgi:hypothetical protein